MYGCTEHQCCVALICIISRSLRHCRRHECSFTFSLFRRTSRQTTATGCVTVCCEYMSLQRISLAKYRSEPRSEPSTNAFAGSTIIGVSRNVGGVTLKAFDLCKSSSASASSSQRTKPICREKTQPSKRAQTLTYPSPGNTLIHTHTHTHQRTLYDACAHALADDRRDATSTERRAASVCEQIRADGSSSSGVLLRSSPQ